ncbi:hypothetical protein [Bacillus sp. PK3_68]|nr:hypothetical protein [Bacillus sp. PK3_68]
MVKPFHAIPKRGEIEQCTVTGSNHLALVKITLYLTVCQLML